MKKYAFGAYLFTMVFLFSSLSKGQTTTYLSVDFNEGNLSGVVNSSEDTTGWTVGNPSYKNLGNIQVVEGLKGAAPGDLALRFWELEQAKTQVSFSLSERI